MDGSDLTERSHRRRLSSILKVSRSPLRDLGFGNVLFQDTTLEKRRKSSRRVSFAETIRVFTPELQENAPPDNENRDLGTDSCTINRDSECPITGIDTLLHGTLYVPVHQTEWNCQDTTKDRTMLFSSDMDMTTSNTVAIEGLSEAKTKKIDTSLFLASLKSQKTDESTSNLNLPFISSDQKHSGTSQTLDSSISTKIKFGDFLASLQNEKTKTENMNSAVYFDGNDKENIFHTHENTGNVTRMFKEQDIGLDLTTCHTTNITTFMPMLNRDFLGNKSINNAISAEEDQTLKGFSHFKPSGSASKSHTSVSNDQTVLLKEDMDITCSHTARIDGISRESNAHQRDAYRNNRGVLIDKTILFNDKNEMEITKNNEDLVSEDVFSPEGPINFFSVQNTTVFPEEDMDITNSHTVAIDGVTIDQMRKQSSACVSEVPAMSEVSKKKAVGFHAEKIVPNRSVGYPDGAARRFSQDSVFLMNRKEVWQWEQLPDTQLNNTTKKSISVFEENKDHSKLTSIQDCGPNNKKSPSVISPESLPFVSSERTVLFTCDQDDMELTKSHTIAIDGKLLEESSKTNVPNRISKDKRSIPGGLRLSSNFNKTVFFSHNNDTGQTPRQTDCTDQNSLNENKNPGTSKISGTETIDFKSAGLKEKLTLSALKINNTLRTDVSENMDLTQSNSFVDKDEANCTRLQSVFLGNNNETDISVNINKVVPGTTSGTVHSILRESSVFRPDNDDIELTNFKTVAIKNTYLCEESKLDKAIACLPFSTSCPDKTIVFEDDMELTKSHTMLIGEEKSVVMQSKPTSANSLLCASGSDEMDITRSHTIFIGNDVVNMTSKGAINTTKIISRLSCGAQKSEYQVGDTKMANVGKPINTGIVQSWDNGTTISGSTGNKSLCEFDKDDMDITRAHTVAIESKLLTGLEKSPNTNVTMNSLSANLMGRTFSGSTGNKTLCEFDKDDMDITRAHTVAIESKLLTKVEKTPNTKVTMDSFSANVLGDQQMVKNSTMPRGVGKPPFSFMDCTIPVMDADMDITKSNTVFIDNIRENETPCSGTKLPAMTNSVQSSRRLTVSGDKTVRKVWDMDLTNTKGCVIFNEADAQAIERNPKLLPSQDKTLMFSCDYNDMDMTRSHTIAIESTKVQLKTDLPANTLLTNANVGRRAGTFMEVTKEKTNDQNNLTLANNFSMVSKGNNERSFDTHDKTNNIVCNMEETNIHFNEGNMAEACKVSLGKTLCDPGDMDITKSYTVAIESKALQDIHIVESCDNTISVCSKVCTNTTTESLYEEMCLRKSPTTGIQRAQPKEALSLTINKSNTNEYLTSEDKSIRFLASDSENKLKHQVHDTPRCIDNALDAADITKANAATVAVEKIEPPLYQGPKASIFAEHGRAKIDSLKSSVETETKGKCTNLIDKPANMLAHPEEKSVPGSTSLLSKTVLFPDDLGTMELTRIHALPIKGVTNEFGFSAVDKTCVFSKEMDITKSNTTVINHKDIDHSMPTSEDLTNTTMKLPSIFNDHPKENHLVSDNSVITCETDMSDGTFKCNSQPSDMYVEKLSVGVKTTCETPIDISPPNPDNNGLPCELAASDDVPILQIESSVPQIDLEGLQENMALKKEKSKRVSFHLPEKVSIRNDPLKPVANKELLSSVSNDCSENSAHITACISKPFIKPSLENNLNEHENLPDMHHINEGVPEGICSIASRRKSIADIQLTLRSLTRNTSSNHTAPVSFFTAQLPITSQGPHAPDSITAPVSSDVSSTSTELAQEKGNSLEETDGTITKKPCLPSRLSAKIFQPKLPNKRHSKANNTQEPVVSSVPEAQSRRSSVTLFKALAAGDDDQCIEEEILPSCPDDQEINSLFPYDVPEGAWEELCKKEALHKNLSQCTLHEDSINLQKRIRVQENDVDIQVEKKARLNEDTSDKHRDKTLLPDNSPEKCSRHEYSSHTSKTMEQTYCSSSSQDSRADGMTVDLSSQQYSQMDSQLPLDTGCEQSLWQKFQDGTITAKEFFILLKIRILIQKPRYSELPANRGTNEALSAEDIMLDQYIYQPRLQVYEEECHSLYQTIEELKVFATMQEKSLVQINSLLWEAMRMCSENELMYFAVKLKNLKAMYAKKSKLLAHERKISVYRKLLHKAQAQWKQVQARISETDVLLKEIDDSISNLEMETCKLDEECRNKVLGGEEIHSEIENLKSLENTYVCEDFQLKERKQSILTQLGSLQAEAQGLDKRLQEPSFSEWELINWTDKEAAFVFLHDSLEVNVLFGDYTNGEHFTNLPSRRISTVVMYSQLNEELAPPSTLLVYRLILLFVKKNGSFIETYKTQNDLPQLLFDLSLVVSRCKLLGEEIQYLTKWGAKYNLVQTQVQNNQVRLLFSSLAALVKFELVVELSESYATVPLVFTVINHIGNIDHTRLTGIMSKVPVGLWHLKRTVESIYKSLLV